eukprot:scaffold105140_cov39-Tisochrysis_lutea.AAC.6
MGSTPPAYGAPSPEASWPRNGRGRRCAASSERLRVEEAVAARGVKGAGAGPGAVASAPLPGSRTPGGRAGGTQEGRGERSA